MKRLFVFLIPIGSIVFIFEYFLEKIPNDYSYKNNYLKENTSYLDILVLGNSHAYRGVISEHFDYNSFNAAYVSQSFDIDFKIYDLYKEKLTNLKYLILNVSYPSLFSSLRSSKEHWRLKNNNLYYNLYLNINPKDYSELFSTPFYYNKIRMKQFYFDNEQMITCDFYGDGYFENRKTDFSVQNAAIRHTNLLFPYYKDYLEKLDEIIVNAKIKNIKILIVTPPARKQYLKNLNIKQLSLMNKILDSLCNRHLNVFRMNELKSNLYLDSDFFDEDHLNKKGALKFTDKINCYLKKIENEQINDLL